MSDNGPVLAVGAIVRRPPDDILLIRRGREPAAGQWSLPGGKIEGHESLEEAVRREVLEETGLQVEAGQLVGWVERHSDDHHFVILDFEARIVADPRTPQAGDDAAEARWVSLGELGTIRLVDGLADFLLSHGVF